MRSATPSSRRSQTARVASGVTSRSAMPVPPVVTTSFASLTQYASAVWIAAWSSETTSVPISENFFFLRSSLTAGPERSTRSPQAQESLIVMTAAVNPSGVEEDIFFFLLWCFAAVALGFVELAQAFHEQALSIEVR